MTPHCGSDAPRVSLSNTVNLGIELSRTAAAAPPIASYDLNKVIEAARGWHQKAATTPDPAASEACRRSAAMFEHLVLRSLDTPAIC